MSTRLRRLGACAFVCLVGSAFLGTSGAAALGIVEYSGRVDTQSGDPQRLAGGTPEEMKLRIAFAQAPLPDLPGTEFVEGSVKDLSLGLPKGLIGNPQVVDACRVEQLMGAQNRCPAGSTIGSVETYTGLGRPPLTSPVFNMAPSPGLPAQFGMNVAGVGIFFAPTLRPDDYGIEVSSLNTSQGVPIHSLDVTIWGVPAAPEHDPQRWNPEGNNYGSSTDLEPRPFLINPTDCEAVRPAFTARADSWQAPGQFGAASFDEDPLGNPFEVEGCGGLPFAPALSFQTEHAIAGQPTGLDVNLTLPQSTDPGARATAHLRDAKISLPAGMTISPASAAGLGSCSEAALGLGSGKAAACPQDSKIGTVEATTPLLEETLRGGVFLRDQISADPESGEMYRMAISLESAERGVVVKLPGSLRVGRADGRVVASFEDNPQLPFSALRVRFKGGPRAPLVNPPECGSWPVESELVSWAGHRRALVSPIEVSEGCGVRSFSPKLEAGTVNPLAGAYSPFVLRVTQDDGAENLAAIDLTLPEGLLAKLAGVPLCGEAAAAAGTCGEGSLVGRAVVGVGAGSSPLFLPLAGREPTSVHLAGPYKGAPYSLVVVVPAQAGPFDLGTVVVRSSLEVDPVTAQVTAKSDPLPQIVGGVPIAYRDVRLAIDRPEFTLNPTSCRPAAATSRIRSVSAGVADPVSRFQAAGCERLAFKPKLSLRLKGATRRSGRPQLTAVLTQRPGGANVARASVAMPRSAFLAQDHIRTVCTRVQFAANACPKGSVYGRARAFTPLLDRPLEGPVYLRSSDNQLPDLVADLRGQIEIELVGRIDSKNGGIRTTFDTVPDAPVSRFVLRMGGGKRSLLENSENLCRSKDRATVEFGAHSGKVRDFRPLVRASCGRGAQR